MKRAAVLLYGLVVYAIFLPTFCYAIGFIGNLIVPKGIDDGAESTTLTALLVNAGLLLLFAVQHNVMARPAFKRVWTRIVHPAVERSTFVLITCAILGLMFWQWRPMTGVVWSVGSPIPATVLWALFGAGWAVVLVSTFLIDHFGLFGLRQTVGYALRREPTTARFAVKGFYRYVRHPLMTGFLLAFWAAPTMTVGRLVFGVVTAVWILFSLRLEERDLVGHHGEAYREYQRSVPMLLPIPKRADAPAPVAQG